MGRLPPQPASDRPWCAPVRVLIVQDDSDLGPILVRGMALNAIAADLVSTGQEAIVRATATEYAVIVLDVMLPDCDGVQLCRDDPPRTGGYADPHPHRSRHGRGSGELP